MIKRYLYYFAVVFAAVSCIGLQPDQIEIVQLGIVEDTVTAGPDQCACGVKVLSDRDYSISFDGGAASWIHVIQTTRDTIAMNLDANDGFRRCAYLEIAADGRKDQVQIRQEGKWKESVSLSKETLNVPASGYSGSVRVMSNMPSDYMKAVTNDVKGLSNVSLEDYILHFTVLPSHNRDARTLIINIEYVNGWDELISIPLTIYQEAYE